ncbi:YceK/YidQ family lipoprotein [Planctomycetota bacterium]
MLVNISKISVLTVILITTSLLSGCMSTFHGMAIDDPPYEGTKLGIYMLKSYFSSEATGKDPPIGYFVFIIIDLPFSFVADTVRLPFDLIEISKYPEYHGKVLHNTTGEVMSGVVVMAAADVSESESPLTREEFNKRFAWRYYHTNPYIEVRRIGNRDYGFVARTRTNKNGEFFFKLNKRMRIKRLVAFKKGYKDAVWQPDGYFLQDMEVPTLYLIPEAD